VFDSLWLESLESGRYCTVAPECGTALSHPPFPCLYFKARLILLSFSSIVALIVCELVVTHSYAFVYGWMDDVLLCAMYAMV
jgi:hypothetical protein